MRIFKNMFNNRFSLVILSVSLGLCFVGCTKNGKKSYDELSKEVDSLKNENTKKLNRIIRSSLIDSLST